MNSRLARQHLILFRPGDETERPRFAEALAALPADATLSSEFQLDQAVDLAARSALMELNPTEEERHQLQSELAEIQSRKRQHRLSLSDPGVLAVALGFLLLIGFGVWQFLGSSSQFPGYAEVVGLSAQAAQLDAGQFEPVEAKLGDMDDWFTMNGLDRFWVPPEFANFQTVGARIMRFENVPVAQLAVPDRQMLLLVFRGQPLGVSIGHPGTWKFIEGKPYSSAITEKEGICFLVSIRGNLDDIQQLIDEVRAEQP